MDYTQLVGAKSVSGSIKNWLNWDFAPSTDILTAAQSTAYSRLRVREMVRYKQDGTIALNASTCLMPADYIAMKTFRRINPNSGKIVLLDEEYFALKVQKDDAGAIIAGTPMYCMIIGGADASDPITAYFDVKAIELYNWSMIYYGRPTALSGTNLTNFLTDRYSWLLQVACLYQANLFKKDLQMAAVFKKEIDEWFYQANVEKDLEAQARQFEPWAIGDGDG